MKNGFKILTFLIFASLIASGTTAQDLFNNDLKEIHIDKNSVGKPEISLTMEKTEDVRVLKKDELEYVILMPETSNSIKQPTSLENVSDIITNVEVKTQPYVGNIKGYTKVTIKTSQPIVMSAKSVLEYKKPIQKETKPQQQKPTIVNQIAQKLNPKEQVKNNAPVDKEVVVPKKPQKIEMNETQPAKEQTEKPAEQQEKVTITEQTEQELIKEIQEEQIAQQQTETQQQAEQKEPQEQTTTPAPTKKEKGFAKSVGITALLLILLLLLKRFNKKKGIPNANEIPQEETPAQENNQLNSAETELPYHEEYSHAPIEAKPVAEQEIQQEQNYPQEPETVPETILEPTMDNIENPIEEPVEEQETLEEEDLENIDEHFNEDVSVDDVFGTLEDELTIQQQTQEIAQEPQAPSYHQPPVQPAQPPVAQPIPPVQSTYQSYQQPQPTQPVQPTIQPEQPRPIQQPQNVQVAQVEPQTSSQINVVQNPQVDDFSFLVQPEREEAKPQVKIQDELPQATNIQEEVEADETETPEVQETSDDNVVKASYDLTPTKSLYLVDYNGVSVLMASVKDEFTVLKRFDEIMDSPLIVRKSEKTSKKTTYIVRVGYYRAVVEVTMKNIELVLEL